VIVTVDQASAIPPYEQLRTQLVTMIQSRVLAPGAQLPPIRQLAKDLGLATGTVQRAYRELEGEGLVVPRGRHGTVVADSAPAIDDRTRVAELARAAETFAMEAKHLGAAADVALTAVRAALAL
jgi:DNA-binding transcriptional regulator YhcF (GntR family)